MTYTAARLAKRVDDPGTDPLWLEACVKEASSLVYQRLGSRVSRLTNLLLDRAIEEAAVVLYKRKDAPNGIAGFATFDGGAARVSLDPMTPVWPIVRSSIGLAIG
jgi:hypothetical protein